MFGAGRSGNVALLQKLGGELGFTLHALRDVELDGQSVSSTRIREAVRAGEFALAGRMLGRPYALCGAGDQGRAVGPQAGFSHGQPGCHRPARPAAAASMPPRRKSAAGIIGRRSTSAIAPPFASADPQLHVEAHLIGF